MAKWFKARWKAYLDSSDPDAALSTSTPGQVAAVVAITFAAYFGCQYIPFLQAVTGMQRAWQAFGLVLLGAASTLVAYRHRCRGTIGALATVLDTTCYTSSIALAAMSMRGNAALAMAALYGVAQMYPAQVYPLTLVFASAMTLPLAIMLAVFRPDLPIAFIVTVSTLVMFVSSSATAHRRTSAKREKELQAALSAADRVADESIQAALTTTLLTLGHFLHELRNYQTSISGNLEYIGVNANLTPASKEALAEARLAQKQEEELVRATIDDLRARSRPTHTQFSLQEALERAKAQAYGVTVNIEHSDFDLLILGNPEHLGVVLLNLIRNAEQAGATRVTVACKPEPSGHAAQVWINDNGEGIAREKRDHLFDSFALSTKPGGSGLGLYLVRRYVELLGGRIEAQPSPMGGAAFCIRVPGKVRPRVAEDTRLVLSATA